MPRFYIDLDGAGRDTIGREFADIEEARNAAIAILGSYLQNHPAFAYQAHWRVDVRDHAGRLVLHVIVATVEAAKPLNIASFAE